MAITWTCNDCVYFDSANDECHRNPPTVMFGVKGNQLIHGTQYPTVAAGDNGCGECMPQPIPPSPPVP